MTLMPGSLFQQSARVVSRKILFEVSSRNAFIRDLASARIRWGWVLNSAKKKADRPAKKTAPARRDCSTKAGGGRQVQHDMWSET
jgi:hypothetical protein